MRFGPDGGKKRFYAGTIGETKNAISCAAELSSRMFKSDRFLHQAFVTEGAEIPLETEFLRWMLSDGAGALLLQDSPSPAGFLSK